MSVKLKLAPYKKKRNFAQTPEPEGGTDSTPEPGRRFVVQMHHARRLHYDFRLEHDGVLLSWAVTKTPSYDPSVKRLAIRTEDHPLEYGDFEGVIPSGYGKGTVMIWDRGTFEPRGDIEEGVKEGALKLTLFGERLEGGWALIRLKKKRGEKRENWLLIKERDGAADKDVNLGEATTSIVSKRDFAAIEADAAAGRDFRLNDPGGDAGPARPSNKAAKRRSGKLPEFIEPQLAMLSEAPPAGENWIHEIKYDGYRLQALVAGNAVKLITRNGKDWTDRFPMIEGAFQALDLPPAAIDGELIAVDERGRNDFSLLQSGATDDLHYCAFDLLSLDGKDLRDAPLTERKARLSDLIADSESRIRYSDHVEGHGETVIARACDMALEGIVSKRANGPYKSGRGRDWLKSKCIGRDEFVIGGYRESDKRSRPFSSLLVGEYKGEALQYRGRVGTGFSDADLDDLSSKMKQLERKTTPFEGLTGDAKRSAVWVTPRLIAEIAYTERTSGGLLRHPSFLGLREDKTAREVTGAGPTRREDTMDESRQMTVAGVDISSADRLVIPNSQVTKGRLAHYLEEQAEPMLRTLKHRPVSLVRCPSGAGGNCFFQKHLSKGFPDAITSVEIREKDGDREPYIVLNSAQAIVSAAQMGAIEFHVWAARTDNIEKPDRLVMDLDPDESLGFDAVKQAAFEMRDVLQSAGLESFALLTGGKGVHVVCPLDRRQDWDDLGDFSRGIARRMAAADPDRYVATASKAKRKGRIFIDWLRNRRGATAIAPFSPRARDGAPVAVPIAWDALADVPAASHVTVETFRQRYPALGENPWKGYGNVRQSLSRAVLDFLGPDD